MDIFSENLQTLSKVYATIVTFSFVRYLLFAGITFLVVWLWKGKKWQHKLIQKKWPENAKMWFEFRYSASTMFIFGLSGVGVFLAKKAGITQMYQNLSDYGWVYFGLSLVGLIFLHDAYFYWAHRLMHHPKIFKRVHLVHHRSTNPSPWAAFSFHPYEAVLEALIVPIAVMIMPLHSLTVFLFILYMTFLNVLGHLSYELFPKGFLKNKILRLHNTTTHHNMHHLYFNCNYSLYFNIWDRLMGTNHPKYFATFDEVTSRKPMEETERIANEGVEQKLETKKEPVAIS